MTALTQTASKTAVAGEAALWRSRSFAASCFTFVFGIGIVDAVAESPNPSLAGMILALMIVTGTSGFALAALIISHIYRAAASR